MKRPNRRTSLPTNGRIEPQGTQGSQREEPVNSFFSVFFAVFFAFSAVLNCVTGTNPASAIFIDFLHQIRYRTSCAHASFLVSLAVSGACSGDVPCAGCGIRPGPDCFRAQPGPPELANKPCRLRASNENQSEFRPFLAGLDRHAIHHRKQLRGDEHLQ